VSTPSSAGAIGPAYEEVEAGAASHGANLGDEFEFDVGRRRRLKDRLLRGSGGGASRLGALSMQPSARGACC